MKNELTKYKNFQIGNHCITTSKIEGNDVIQEGTEFKILNFAPCTIPCEYKYFVVGKTEQGKYVRAFINEIKKK